MHFEEETFFKVYYILSSITRCFLMELQMALRLYGLPHSRVKNEGLEVLKFS